MDKEMYDIIGIGIGPYNLSLAALLDPVEDVKACFFDKCESFEWHPGSLIEGTDLQVNFLSDLVTYADPRSRYTYLNYLHEHNRLMKFNFFEEFDMPRLEYNQYAKWVAGELSSCRFNSEVVDILDHQKNGASYYEVVVKETGGEEEKSYFSKHVAMGTGIEPLIIDGLDPGHEKDVYHSSQYIYNREQTLDSKSVTIVGSGQSAAEIFWDLLKRQPRHEYQLTWFTRSAGIFQTEASKLGQEYFSADYVDYFHRLNHEQRKKALDTLGQLRMGIDRETLNGIYDELFHQSTDKGGLDVVIQPLTEVKEITALDGNYNLHAYQWQEERAFDYKSEKVILSTGYKPHIPEWFDKRIADQIEWEDDKHFTVTRDYKLAFKQPHDNHFYSHINLLHSHGASATNLGLAVERNKFIINDITGKTVYKVPRRAIFTQFSMDKNDRERD